MHLKKINFLRILLGRLDFLTLDIQIDKTEKAV